MDITIEGLAALTDAQLLAHYFAARRFYAEKKFHHDSERGRLIWQSARLFLLAGGRIAEREKAVEANEDLAKRGQQLRECARDVDFAKIDVDLIALVLQTRFSHITPDLAPSLPAAPS